MTADHRAQTAALTQRVVLKLHMVLRTLRVHDPTNHAFASATESLRGSINQLLSLSGREIAIHLVEGELFLNGERLRTENSARPQIRALEKLLRERGLGGLSFAQALEAESLRDFLLAFAAPVRTEADAEEFKASLLALRDRAISLLEPAHFADETPASSSVRVDKRTFALQTYAKAIVSVREYIDSVKQGRPPDPRLRMTRIVMDLVDIASERVNFLLRLSTIKAPDDYPSTHATNTCLLSIVIGKALQMDRLDLVDVGMAALLADVGFALLPQEVLELPRELTDEERDLVRGTMARTIQVFFEGRMSESMMRRVIVALEHHQPYRVRNGDRGVATHIFSRVVQVADAFDALTSHRPWREGYSADEALQILLRESDRYDPVIVKVLVNLLGVYPLGSTVRLESGELAVVYHNHIDPDRFEKPWVRLLADENGEPVRGTHIRDLGQEDGPRGQIESLVPRDT